MEEHGRGWHRSYYQQALVVAGKWRGKVLADACMLKQKANKEGIMTRGAWGSLSWRILGLMAWDGVRNKGC